MQEIQFQDLIQFYKLGCDWTSQKYKFFDKILLPTDIFEQKSCILKKSNVTDGSSNQKRACKNDGIYF
jgi:hypothetical protein